MRNTIAHVKIANPMFAITLMNEKYANESNKTKPEVNMMPDSFGSRQ